MVDVDAYCGRVRHAVLAYVQDHQGLTLEAFSNGVSMPQSDVISALLLLDEQGFVMTSGNIEEASSTWKYFAVMRE